MWTANLKFRHLDFSSRSHNTKILKDGKKETALLRSYHTTDKATVPLHACP